MTDSVYNMKRETSVVDPGSGHSCPHQWNYVATKLRHRALDSDPWVYTTYFACAGCQSIEAVRRKPVSDRAMEWAFRGGMAFLVLLMLVATFNDLGFFGLWDRVGRLIG